MNHQSSYGIDFIYEFWHNKEHDLSNFDRISPEVIYSGATTGTSVGKTGLGMLRLIYDQIFPAMHIQLIEKQEFPNRILTTWSVETAHLGTLTREVPNSSFFSNLKEAKPCGKKICYQVHITLCFFDGKIVNYCALQDINAISQQIGLFLNKVDYEEQNLICKSRKMIVEKLKKILKNEITTKEMECLALNLSGFSAKQIALIMNNSYRTIETHLGNSLQKLNCNSKYQCLEMMYANNHFPIFKDLCRLITDKKDTAIFR